MWMKLGIFWKSLRNRWAVGYTYADIIIEPQNPDNGIIFEFKHSKEVSGLDKTCERALKQIRDRRYSEYLKNDGRHNIMLYGIAFYKKRCKVVVEKLKEA